MWSVLSEERRYGFGEQRGLLRRHRVRCSRNRVAARLGQAPLELGDDSLEERSPASVAPAGTRKTPMP